LPTTLPLDRFYAELVRTQQILNQKHLGFSALKDTFSLAVRFLAHGQTNFVKMLWKFSKIYNPERQFADHHRDVKYPITLPAPLRVADQKVLFVHKPQGVAGTA
jgi:hypothetical protein